MDKNLLVGLAVPAAAIGGMYLLKTQAPTGAFRTAPTGLTQHTVVPGDRLRATVYGEWNNVADSRNVQWWAEFADLGGQAQWHGHSPDKTLSGSGSDTNNCPGRYASGSNSGHVQDTGNYGETRIKTYIKDIDTGEILGEAVTSEYLIYVAEAATFTTSFQGWAQGPW